MRNPKGPWPSSGRRFRERVHRALEAAPPVVSPWPPAGWPPFPREEGEESRWDAIREAIPASRLYRDLCRSVPAGTELPLLSFRGGWSREERADLVVRFPAGTTSDGDREGPECWVIDYKTGRREAAEEETYREQVRGYAEILSAAWKVTVRGFVWYIETGESFEV